MLVAVNALCSFLACGVSGKLQGAKLLVWSGLALAVVCFVVDGTGPAGITGRNSPTTATAVLIQPNLDVEHTGYWHGPGEWQQHIADFIKLGGENCKTYIAGIPQTGAPEGEIVCPPYPTHPDLIVWPESPAPFFEQDPRFQQSMADVARAEQAPLVVNGIGSEFDKQDNEWLDYVSAMVFDANGKEVGRYDKIHLVPWGEYVPFPKALLLCAQAHRQSCGLYARRRPQGLSLTDGHGGDASLRHLHLL